MKVRLNQFLRKTGLFKVKKDWISPVEKGEVTIGGEVITNPLYQFNPKKRNVCWNGRLLREIKNKVYIIINKPEGYLSSRLTKNDTLMGKRSVFELIRGKIDEKTERTLFCVGRLDEDTSGLLILTNDGKLGPKIAFPEHGVKKTYEVFLKKPIDRRDILKIEEGIKIKLENHGRYFWHRVKPCRIEMKNKRHLNITISEGKKREVRRIFESVGNKVLKLQRIRIGNLSLNGLRKGRFILVNKELLCRKIGL